MAILVFVDTRNNPANFLVPSQDRDALCVWCHQQAHRRRILEEKTSGRWKDLDIDLLHSLVSSAGRLFGPYFQDGSRHLRCMELADDHSAGGHTPAKLASRTG